MVYFDEVHQHSSNMALACPLCKEGGIKFLFTKQSIPFYRCPACLFIFSRPAHNPNFANNINEFEAAYLDYFSEKPNDRRNHEFILGKIRMHKKESAAHILDVGCGSGKFVKYLRRQGYSAYGLEPSRAVFDAFLRKDSYYFKGTVPEYLEHYPLDKFAVITVSDAIEHVDDPDLFMKAVTTLLLPDGLLFVSTPDTRSLFARIAGRNWHYYNKYHLSLFSLSNLTALSAKHDLSRIRSGYVSRYHSIYYLLKYLLNFILHREKPIPHFCRASAFW